MTYDIFDGNRRVYIHDSLNFYNEIIQSGEIRP